MKTNKLPNRPPETVYKIRVLIEAGRYTEAQFACDQCELYFSAKAAQMRELFLIAERGKRGEIITKQHFEEAKA